MKKLFIVISLFTLASLNAFERQKETMITQLYSYQRHQLMPKVRHKKFMGNYLTDASKMFKCMQFSIQFPERSESQNYFTALTNYIIENFMYEWVLRKSQRFVRRHDNKLSMSVINLRNAMDSIHKTGLAEFDLNNEFNRTRAWFTQANTEYFKRIGLKK